MSSPDTLPSFTACKTAVAPPFSVNPQSPSPAMVSILVISGSAWMIALQALLTVKVKAEGSWALTGTLELSKAEASRDTLDEGWKQGGTREDHFQPGASVGSSRSERSKSLVCCPSGRRRSVIENPGMFRLVFSTVSDQLTGCSYGPLAYHEGSRDESLH